MWVPSPAFELLAAGSVSKFRQNLTFEMSASQSSFWARRMLQVLQAAMSLIGAAYLSAGSI